MSGGFMSRKIVSNANNKIFAMRPGVAPESHRELMIS
jgi:hypothetical protein